MMNGNSLIEYLGKVRPTTPQEMIAGMHGWVQYQTMVICEDMLEQVFNEFINELKKWLKE